MKQKLVVFATLEYFKVDDLTSQLLMKKLNSIARYINEDKHIGTMRNQSHAMCCQTSKRMDTLAHIGRLTEK